MVNVSTTKLKIKKTFIKITEYILNISKISLYLLMLIDYDEPLRVVIMIDNRGHLARIFLPRTPTKSKFK